MGEDRISTTIYHLFTAPNHEPIVEVIMLKVTT